MDLTLLGSHLLRCLEESFANFDFKFSSERRTGEAPSEDVTFTVEDYNEDVKNGKSTLVLDIHKTQTSSLLSIFMRSSEEAVHHLFKG